MAICETHITEHAGVVTDIRRVIYIYCDRCGGFELLFSVCEAKVIAIIPADQPADDNRILSKLPRRSTAPRGTAKSKVVYAPAEVFA